MATAAAATLVATAGAPAHGDPAPAFTPVAGSPFTAGNGPTSVAFSKSGRLLAVSNFGDDTVSVFSVAAAGTPTQVSGSPFTVGSGPEDATFSPNGSLLAVASAAAKSISLFTVSGTTLAPVSGSPFATSVDVHNIEFSPNGMFVAATDFNADSVDLLAVSGTGASTTLAEVTHGPYTVAAAGTPGFSSDGTLLAVPDYTDDNVAVFSVAGTGAAATLTAVTASPFATGSGPTAVAFSPTGNVLAVANQTDNTVSTFSVGGSGTATTLSADTGSPFATGQEPGLVAFNAAGTMLAVPNLSDGDVSVFSVAQGALTAVDGSPFATDYLPTWAAFSPTGGVLATANAVGSDVSVFSVAAPSASISSPATGGWFRHNQVVSTAYGCDDGSYGPGISTCTDGHGGTGGTGTLPTGINGPRTYTVTATSKDGQTATSSIAYTVDGTKPTVKFTTPPPEGNSFPYMAGYSKGDVIHADYSCHDDNAVAMCAGTVASGAALDTSSLGQQSFSVTAKDLAGNPGVLQGTSNGAPVTYYRVCPPDGSGTLTASPTDVPAGENATITFSYKPAPGCVWRGAIVLKVPSGWSAPSLSSSDAGYTTGHGIGQSTGLAVAGQTITLDTGLTTQVNGQSATITYGTAGSKQGAKVGSTVGPTIWHPQAKTTGPGVLTPVAEPGIFVVATDGSGTMTASKSLVFHSSPHQVIAFTYTASGPIRHGSISLQVPAGWSVPDATTRTAPGYSTTSGGTLTVADRTIVVHVTTLAAGQTVTITYGSRAAGGPGATTPSSTGTQEWTTSEQSAQTSHAAKLASGSPSVRVR